MTEAGVVVEEATAVTAELLDAMGQLVPQLSSSGLVPTVDEVSEIVASPATVLLVARDAKSRIVGSLTLALFRIPTGVRAWVEDVVVDRSVRGMGIGAALIAEALQRAVDAGARTVDLTSRPSRQEANRLYRRMGFEMRETNVYRVELK